MSAAILLVDPDEDLRALVAPLLGARGHTVHEAGCAAEAESLLARARVDALARAATARLPGQRD